MMDAMAEQVAQVANLLPECVPIGVRILIDSEKQRVAALTANVLVVSCPFGDPDVVVTQQKTRNCMRHTCFFVVFEKLHTASAMLSRTAVHAECVVVDSMSEECAGQFLPLLSAR
jgi:hypothetical protein